MKPKKLQLITKKTIIQIKDYVYPQYSVDDDENSWFPKVICDSCRKSLRVKVCSYLYLYISMIHFQLSSKDSSSLFVI